MIVGRWYIMVSAIYCHMALVFAIIIVIMHTII